MSEEPEKPAQPTREELWAKERAELVENEKRMGFGAGCACGFGILGIALVFSAAFRSPAPLIVISVLSLGFLVNPQKRMIFVGYATWVAFILLIFEMVCGNIFR